MTFPLIIAHRGDAKHAPENTLAAFDLAIAKGADAIEFDLHQTLDGELVVHHDYTLDRTTTGSGQISDYTLNELRALDAGSSFSPDFAGEAIPTLSEVLELGKGLVRFEIELRCATLSFLNKVIHEIEDHGVASDVEITSSHIPLLPFVRLHQKELRVGYFVPAIPEWKSPELGSLHLIQWLKLIDAQVAHLSTSMLHQPIVDSLRDQGYLVHGTNLNEAEGIQGALSLGVDQFSTDKIDLALELRQRHHADTTD